MEKNLSRSKEGTLASLPLNTFCRRWGHGRGKCFALGSAQLSSSSLTPFSVASLHSSSPPLPVSEKSLSQTPSLSCLTPAGTPGCLTPLFGSPQSMSVLPFVFHLMVQQAVCVSPAPTSIISLISSLGIFTAPELDGIYVRQSCFHLASLSLLLCLSASTFWSCALSFLFWGPWLTDSYLNRNRAGASSVPKE